jgi:hypothetical protein
MATKPTSLQDVFDRNQYDLKTAVTKSKSWFEQQVLLMNKQAITPQKVLSGSTQDLTVQVLPGYLYMYMYDPKTKADLPYYDRFPLVFPFRKVEGGFLGLNMHYLPYQLRIKLLDKLMVFASNSKLNEATKLKYSWALIDGVSRYAEATPCVKHYLMSQVKSPFRKINSEDWATAMMLPVERFIGAAKDQVWMESKRKIR